ncbi:MAG TPA: ABC transporter ATP-binding protein [Chloroflexota bacterium]|nr:ABC transporter ATP-binding protein [Chloroflexota bacterium]
MAAIQVQNLRKSYGDRVVVNDLSFEVGIGEVFALLGPNGAGKTTTIEILEGYRDRDGGTVTVLGFDPQQEASHIRQRIGLMLQEGGVYPQARPKEMLDLFASFYPNPDDPERLIKLVGLEDAQRTAYRRLSGGQKQRLSLALALIGRPELVFLDEPTAGMDPHARRSTWEIIRSLRESGVTVVLTTHYMEEAERLADQIGIIDRGVLVAIGDMASLRQAHIGVVRLVVPFELDPAELASLPGVAAVRDERAGTYLLDTGDAPALLVALTEWAQRRSIPIREIRVGGESLEDVFMRLTRVEGEGDSVSPEGDTPDDALATTSLPGRH